MSKLSSLNILTSTAQNIVDEIKKIIQQDINFFTLDGSILASTDASRIGETNHEGAITAMKENEVVIINYDNEYEGARKGINLAITLDHEVVGAIGVTGDHKEVIKYAEIIKQMTEILIRENISKELIFNSGNSYHYIIDYIISEKFNAEQSRSIEVLYNFNFIEYRTCIIAKSTHETTMLSLNQSDLFREIYFLLGNESQDVFEIRGESIIIISNQKSSSQIINNLQTIYKVFKDKFNVALSFGIGTTNNLEQGYVDSLHTAEIALNWNLNVSHHHYAFYNDLKHEALLMSLGQEQVAIFLNKIFGNLKTSEIEEIVDLMDVYTEVNGSINEAAEKLFIHKNTVQYRLNKIKNHTGLDPRLLNDYFVLELACAVYKLRSNYLN